MRLYIYEQQFHLLTAKRLEEFSKNNDNNMKRIRTLCFNAISCFMRCLFAIYYCPFFTVIPTTPLFFPFARIEKKRYLFEKLSLVA